MAQDNSSVQFNGLREALDIFTPVIKAFIEDPEKALALVKLLEAECASRPASRSSTATVGHQKKNTRGARPSKKRKGTPSGLVNLKCQLCSEVKTPWYPIGINGTSEKWDLKRHIENYHRTDTQWTCPEPACGLPFHWNRALDAHLREDHQSNSRGENDKIETPLCPQLVFACGYSGCRQVFVSTELSNTKKEFGKYIDHLTCKAHWEKGDTDSWSRETRFRNLLRQDEHMNKLWKECKTKLPRGSQLHWPPNTLNILIKMLETRHLPDPESFVRCAFELGRSSKSDHELPEIIRLPIKGRCGLSHDEPTGIDLNAQDGMLMGVGEGRQTGDSLALHELSSSHAPFEPDDALAGYLPFRQPSTSYDQINDNNINCTGTQQDSFIMQIDPQLRNDMNTGSVPRASLDQYLFGHTNHVSSGNPGSSASGYGISNNPSLPYPEVSPTRESFEPADYHESMLQLDQIWVGRTDEGDRWAC
ncbi:hypothetical protein QBC43DRAFT_294874 [Cladorrhinum sp. PSN259]|nr:hypothetical protein QBC43DRAFT_294874 [Cladorrhinum sp. PSN259]